MLLKLFLIEQIILFKNHPIHLFTNDSIPSLPYTIFFKVGTISHFHVWGDLAKEKLWALYRSDHNFERLFAKILEVE